jgi:hypothetical protein
LATLEDFLAFASDVYGIPKEATLEFKVAWHSDDAKKLGEALKSSIKN